MDEFDDPPAPLSTESVDEAFRQLNATYADPEVHDEHIVAAHQRLLAALVDAVRTLTTEINRLNRHKDS